MTKLFRSLAMTMLTLGLLTASIIIMSEMFTEEQFGFNDYMDLVINLTIISGPPSLLFWLILLPKKDKQ